MKIAAFETLP